MRQLTLQPVTMPPQAEMPLIIQYTNLLHQYRDPGAPAVVAFVQTHCDDAVFVRRVDVLNKVFRLKEDLVQPES